MESALPPRRSRTPLRLVGELEAWSAPGSKARDASPASGAARSDAPSRRGDSPAPSRDVEASQRGPLRADPVAPEAPGRRESDAKESARFIAFENAAAARHSDSAKEAFAILVEEAIEGGRAAIIRPEVRRDLVIAGEAKGLRPFEAQLTIAMVQDAARHGEVVRRVPASRGPGQYAVDHDAASLRGAGSARGHFTSQLVLAAVMGMIIFAALVVAVLRA